MAVSIISEKLSPRILLNFRRTYSHVLSISPLAFFDSLDFLLASLYAAEIHSHVRCLSTRPIWSVPFAYMHLLIEDEMDCSGKTCFRNAGTVGGVAERGGCEVHPIRTTKTVGLCIQWLVVEWVRTSDIEKVIAKKMRINWTAHWPWQHYCGLPLTRTIRFIQHPFVYLCLQGPHPIASLP